jgi:hypothetical protein
MSVALTYPSISGVSGAPNIPAMSDVADIQTALKYLYYGSTATENVANGIYGLLYNLKQYIDASISGINVHEVVKYASTAVIAGTYTAGTADSSGGTGIGAIITYSATGTQYLDGVGNLLALNQRVLVKNGVTADSGVNSKANGIYVVTTAPAVGVAGILTRSEDSNNSIAGEMGEGDFMFVSDGTTLNNTSWILTSTSVTGTGPAGSIKIGTDPVTYQQYSGVGTYYIGTTAATLTSGSIALAGLSSITAYPSTALTVASTDNAAGASSALTVATGTGTTGTSGAITISTGVTTNATSGSSGAITISTPAGTGSSAGNSGAITISTGNGAGSGGASGDITLNAGSAVTTGIVKLANTVGSLQLGRTGLTLSVPGIINTLISGTAATNILWAENLTGTMTIGAGLTTGTLSIGGTTNISTGTRTINLGTGGVTTSGTTQTINIATTATSAAATSSINIGATGSTTTIAGTLVASAPAGSLTGSSLPAGITSASGLATVGTITSGTWNGSVIDIARGGTNSTATATAGGIGYGTGTAHAYTAAGTSGQVLTSNAGSAPTWTAAGGKTLIAQVTNAASATTLTFSSIPQTYKSLELQWYPTTASATAGSTTITFANSTATNYSYAILTYPSTSSGVLSTMPTSSTGIGQAGIVVNALPSTNSISTLTIDNYTSTSSAKIGRYNSVVSYSSSNLVNGSIGWVLAATAVTSITLTFAGTITGQVMTGFLYGIN